MAGSGSRSSVVCMPWRMLLAVYHDAHTCLTEPDPSTGACDLRNPSTGQPAALTASASSADSSSTLPVPVTAAPSTTQRTT